MRHCQGAARNSGMRARRASGAGEAVPYQRARARETPTVCPWRVPMDRADLSAAIIQEMGAEFMAALTVALPKVLASYLAAMEQQLRVLSRRVCGAVVGRVSALQPAGLQRL